MDSDPVERSNEMRHGLRSPYAQISSRPAVAPVGPGPAAARVDPQDLAEQVLGLALRIATGVAGPAAVTGPDVEVAVRPERHRTAVVIGVRTVLDDEHRLERRARGPTAGCVGTQSGDHDVAAGPRVVDVQPAVDLELGMEDEAEETPLARCVADERTQVEERASLDRAVLVDADDAALLDEEEPVRPVAGIGDLCQRLQTAGAE